MSEETVWSERPHGTNWSGLKLTEANNGAERVRGDERERGKSAGLEDSETTCAGIPALL